jgi:hypothetical protein
MTDHPGVTGRKPGRPVQTNTLLPPSMEPLLVSVLVARQMLGGMSKNKFWELARSGAFELVGSERKRMVVVSSLRRFVDQLPRRDAPARTVQTEVQR